MNHRTPPAIGTIIWHAQVVQARGKPPTARVLEGRYLHPSKLPGKWRVNFRHTPAGLDVLASLCATDPVKAQALLTNQLAALQHEHLYQIGQLKQALADHLKTLTICWHATGKKQTS